MMRGSIGEAPKEPPKAEAPAPRLVPREPEPVANDVRRLRAAVEEIPYPESLTHGRIAPKVEWPPSDLEELVESVPHLTDDDLPAYPFDLNEFCRVIGPAWLASIKLEVEQGPAGARAKLGVLQQDLRCLKRVLAGGGPCTAKLGESYVCRKDAGHLPPHEDEGHTW